MPTLYVENIPEDLYEAIRARARTNRTSISVEVLALLSENVATPNEIARRRALLDRARELRSRRPVNEVPPSAAEGLLQEEPLR